MANPAAVARAAVLASWPQAQVVERYGNGLKHLLVPGGGRYALDVGVGQGADPNIGPWQFRQGGYWRESDTAHLLDGVDGFAVKTGNLPFHTRMAVNGMRRIYPILGDLTRYIEVGPNNFTLPAPTLKGEDFFYWNLTNLSVTLQTTTAFVKLSAMLKNALAPTVYKFNVGLVRLTRSGGNIMLGPTVVATIRPPTAHTTLTRKVVPVTWNITAGVLTITVNTSGVTWAADGQVELDPTLDLQVGASTDDAYPYGKTNGDFGSLDLTTGWQQFGTDAGGQYGAAQRFTAVIIPDGSSITVAYITLTGRGSVGQDDPSLVGHIYAHDQAAPVTYSTVGDLNGRPKTTATVDWSNPPVATLNVEFNTPSIVSIIQELMASYSYAAGSAMGFVLYGTAGVTNTNRAYWSYNSSAAKAAKVHIEYTAGGATFTATAALSFGGTILKQNNQRETAAISFAGGVRQQISRTLSAIQSFAGAVTKATSKTIDASLSFGGGITKRISHTLTGVLSWVGDFAKWITRRGIPAVTLSSAQVGTLALSHAAVGVLALSNTSVATLTLSCEAYTP